jgi:hypothetical protein
MVGMFEDPTQSKEWASRRAACIWRRDTQGKFHGTLFRREALGCGCILGHRGVHASSSLKRLRDKKLQSCALPGTGRMSAVTGQATHGSSWRSW